MAGNKRAGILYFKKGGTVLDAKGNFTYNLGRNKREMIIGADRVHGHKEMPQAPRIEGEITDKGDLDVAQILDTEDETLTLELRNGKTIVLKEAVYTGDGDIGTEEANIQVVFHGTSCEEI